MRYSIHCGDKSGTVLIGMKTTLWQYIMFYVSFMSFIVILMRGCISGKVGVGGWVLSFSLLAVLDKLLSGITGIFRPPGDAGGTQSPPPSFAIGN